MPGRYKIEIDGVDYSSSVRGMTEMIITKKRNNFIRGLFTTFSSKLLFVDESYEYIKGQLDTLGYRAVMDAVIYENTTGSWAVLIEGKLIISDLSWNLSRRSVEGKVTDKIWGAMIQNSKGLKFQLDVGRSKNDFEITACASIASFLFTPSTCSYDFPARTIYEVRDAFRFLVHAMTDGTVNFISDWFDDSTNFIDTDFIRDIDVWTNVKPYIARGYHIRDATQDSAPSISFQDLYLAMNANCNLSIQIEDDTTAPSGKRIRLENTEFFFADNSSLAIDNILDVEFSVDAGQLYSSIKIGNQDYLLAGDFDNTDRFLTFAEETYIFQGEGNADRELDISNRFISDTNMIEAQLSSTEEEFDERIFIITVGDEEVEGLRHAVRFTKTPSTGANCYYNNNFLNNYIAARWAGSIPNNLTYYIGSTDFFMASVLNPPAGYITRTITPSGPPQTFLIGFDDETTGFNHDIGNNYTNTAGNYYYTVPVATFWWFKTKVRWLTVTAGTNQLIKLVIRIQRKDGNNVLLEEFLKENIISVSGTNIHLKQEKTVIFNVPAVPATQRISVSATVEAVSVTSDVVVTVMDGSRFQNIGGGPGGGIYQIGDPDGFRARKYIFDTAITMSQWRTIDNNPSQKMTINPVTGAENLQSGWIDKLEFTPETGKAKTTLIT